MIILIYLMFFFSPEQTIQISFFGESQIIVYVNNKIVDADYSKPKFKGYNLIITEKDKISILIEYIKISHINIIKNSTLIVDENINKNLIIKFKKSSEKFII